MENLHITIRKIHFYSFTALIFSLLGWGVTRATMVHLSVETQMLIYKHFYLTGWLIWCMVAVFVLTALLVCISGFIAKPVQFHKIIQWAAYMLMIGIIAWFFTAFRISAIGLHAFLIGMENSTEKAGYLLLNFYPYFPLTPLNLCVGADSYIAAEQFAKMISTLDYLIVSYIVLLGLSFLSLIILPKNRPSHFFAILFTLAGIGFNFLIETGFRDIPQPLPEEFLIAAPVFNFFGSAIAILLAGVFFYRFCLTLPIRFNIGKNEEDTAQSAPPIACLVLILFFVLAPCLADMENIHSLERKGREIVQVMEQ